MLFIISRKKNILCTLNLRKQVRNESRCLFPSAVKDRRNAIESE